MLNTFQFQLIQSGVILVVLEPENNQQLVASTNHQGIDIKVPIGTPIISVKSGTVEYAGWQNINHPKVGFDKYIKVKNDDGTTSYYGHLSEIQITNGRVIAGQTLAKSGNTGASSGPHLHYGEKENGKWINSKKSLDDTLKTSTQLESPPLLLQPKINSKNSILNSDKNENYINSELEDLLSQNFVDQDNKANQSTVNQGNQNPTNQSENIPQEEVSVDEVKDMLASEDIKQTANFMSEVKLQLPSMMGVMVARLALGEDVELVSADMASRLIATSAINAYAENNWSSSGEKRFSESF